MHEFYSKSPGRGNAIEPGSNRNFGLVMAGAFLVLAGLQLYSGSAAWALIWGLIATAFASFATLTPGCLGQLNRMWFRFGLLLNRIVSPLVLGLLFFAVVTPIGLLMRMFGQRPLALGFDKTATSYWVVRTEPTAPPGSMRKQF
jgi:hypothetical protein